MALREEFESTGTWLFRWRSYLPMVLLLPTWLAMTESPAAFDSGLDRHAWEIICLGVSILGQVVRALTVAHIPKGTSGRNTDRQVALVLNTTGMYSIVRHPLYLGNFLVCCGFAMFCCRWWLVVIYALVFWVYYERIMFAEEEFLRQKFGDRYLAWAGRTPAFIPRFSLWRSAELPFSFRNLLRREYSGLATIAGVYLGLEIMQQLAVEQRIFIRPFWHLLAVVALAGYTVLRMLKVKTRLLHVDGR